MVAAFLVLLVACLFQGTMGITFKKYRPFSWEGFWLIFSVIGFFLIPHLWAMIEVPNYQRYLFETPTDILVMGGSLGVIWGISAIFYMKAIDMIGVSLLTGINLGFSLLLGTFVPMFFLPELPPTKTIFLLSLSMVILMTGVFILSKAGAINDLKKSEVASEAIRNDKDHKGHKNNKIFVIGVVLALASGLGSAALNVGAAITDYPVKAALAEGVSPDRASILSWLVVFAGGSAVNILYALYELTKNKTFSDFIQPKTGRGFLISLVVCVAWFGGLAGYGKASALLGSLGPMIGWVAFNALSLIIANVFGFYDGEWSSSRKARNLALAGNAIIIISLVFVAMSN